MRMTSSSPLVWHGEERRESPRKEQYCRARERTKGPGVWFGGLGVWGFGGLVWGLETEGGNCCFHFFFTSQPAPGGGATEQVGGDEPCGLLTNLYIAATTGTPQRNLREASPLQRNYLGAVEESSRVVQPIYS